VIRPTPEYISEIIEKLKTLKAKQIKFIHESCNHAANDSDVKTKEVEQSIREKLQFMAEGGPGALADFIFSRRGAMKEMPRVVDKRAEQTAQ
jgi:hypothetical protein